MSNGPGAAVVVWVTLVGIGLAHAQQPPLTNAEYDALSAVVGGVTVAGSVCDVGLLPSSPNRPETIVAVVDFSGRLFCNTVVRVSRTAPPVLLQEIPGWWVASLSPGALKVIQDVDGDGEVELVVPTAISDYEGARACIATLPLIYRCDATRCVDISSDVPEFYREWRAPLTARLGELEVSSDAAAHHTVMRSVVHSTRQYENNRAEVSHQPTRQRERQMRRFKSAAQAQRFLSVHGFVQNLFRVGRHLPIRTMWATVSTKHCHASSHQLNCAGPAFHPYDHRARVRHAEATHQRETGEEGTRTMTLRSLWVATLVVTLSSVVLADTRTGTAKKATIQNWSFTVTGTGQMQVITNWTRSSSRLIVVVVCGLSDPRIVATSGASVNRLAILQFGAIPGETCLVGVNRSTAYRIHFIRDESASSVSQGRIPASLDGVTEAEPSSILAYAAEREIERLRAALAAF